MNTLITTEEFAEIPVIAKLLDDLESHIENAHMEEWRRMFTISIRQFLEERDGALEKAIRKHRDQTGHNLCWENDEELWSVLADGVKIDHTPPPWGEFMTKCAAYRESREVKK